MPKPRIIVCANQKGGVGKSTMTGHLAVQAGLAGDGPVAILDTDPQGSLAAWWNEREDPAPAFVRIEAGDIAASIAAAEQSGAAYVFFDTPPAATSSIAEVVGYADLVLIPVKPSPHDLRALGRTVDLVKGLNKRFAFIVTHAKQNALLTVQTMAALSQFGVVSPAVIHDRVDYAASMIDGRTVVETDPRGRSAAEIVECWEFVKAQFDGMSAARFDKVFKSLRASTTETDEAAA